MMTAIYRICDIIKNKEVFIMKRKKTIYIDEKFVRKFGIENQSKIVNEALKKYYTEERENFKNDLQILNDFKQEIKDLNFEIKMIKEMVHLNFSMTTMSAYSADVIKENHDGERITKKIEEIKADYKSLINT